MPVSNTQHDSIRFWLLSGGFIAVCALFMAYGIIALIIALHPSLIVITLGLTISGAITLSLGSLRWSSKSGHKKGGEII